MAGIRTENKVYEVGMYCRLSKDDGTDNESASIATQKSILTDYVKKQGWHLAKTYVDDGYSGTNFQRPSFQNMIKDIESGLINCVITKDLSRLGRNYLDCGLYLEVFFPEHNVRYIAVNDGVDTLNKSAMDITPFRNILNEMYSADVSVKIKSAYRARFQQGKFMGTTAPYGYVKDPADHNHLLIDDKVAHVVREIFDLALAGNGIAKIRKHINKQHILRPAAYAVEQGSTGYERHFEGNEENRYIWSENSVRGILRSPIYAGNLAGYKRIAANMKSKKRPSKLPEEWEVIPDTHEGIVTQEEFDNVQQLITSRRLPENKGGFENIFAGVIKCADCGYAMRAMSANRRKRPDIIDCVQYTCNNYGRYGNIMCTAHSIEARDLFNAVLIDINRFADMAVSDEKAVRAIEKRLTETDQSRAKALEKEQRKLNKRLAELDRLFSSLYEDKVMERITERNFEMMSGKYQKEQLEIEARLKEVTETLNDSYEKSQGVRDFLSLIRNYQGIKELDATIINALIDKILVSEREKLTDGTVRQEIKIYYKFIGFVGELHITPTKRWTALKPKNCTVCGVEYVPRSAISKYCPECRKRIRKVQGTETKRRSRERNRQACIELSAKNDRLKKNREEYYKQINTLSAETVEYVRGIPVVKTFGQSVESFKRLYTSIIVMKDSVLKMTMGYRNKMSMFEATSGSTAFFLVPAALFIIAAGENPHEVVADSIIYFLIGPIFGVLIMRTATISQYLYFAELALDKIEDILEYDEMAYGKEDQTTGGIEFKNVSFSYGSEKVLDNISFKVNRGETVALVGRSGSGKTTIARLAARFYDADEGEVLLGGSNIKEYDKTSLMRKISFVFQNARLFKMSLRENLLCGKEDAIDKEIEQALFDAGAKEIVDGLKDGLETVYGTKGTYFSGGEAQRLVIARAFLKDAEYVILDEATAFADPENERIIQESFKKLAENKTTLLIAHRLSTVVNADKILVIEKGRIAEEGKHEALLEKNGIYKSLWDEYRRSVNWKIGGKND